MQEIGVRHARKFFCKRSTLFVQLKVVPEQLKVLLMQPKVFVAQLK
jgi:hypothetical protein